MTHLKVVRPIGRGGFGRALLVLDGNQHKVLKEMCTDKMDDAKRRAVSQEINALKLMKHANIIRYEKHFFKNGNTYILMEYADAGDLHAFISSRNGALIPEDLIIDWFVQMCLALKYLHDRKMVHRDIKPGNFFLTKGGIVKLGDFGLATFLPNTNALVKTAIGTPYYVAPEVCRGTCYNQKADVWALGCVLYELCTLKKAFSGFSIRDLMVQIQCRKPPRLPSPFSDELRTLLSFMLRKDPSERPTVNEILTLPFMRFKAIALLGKTQARCELSHTVFHGLPAGETPEDVSDEIMILNEQKALAEAITTCYTDLRSDSLPDEITPECDKIVFMGRTLVLKNIGPESSPQAKAETLRAFIEEIVGVTRFHDLYTAITTKQLSDVMSRTDSWVCELIVRLIACEEAANEG